MSQLQQSSKEFVIQVNIDSIDKKQQSPITFKRRQSNFCNYKYAGKRSNEEA